MSNGHLKPQGFTAIDTSGVKKKTKDVLDKKIIISGYDHAVSATKEKTKRETIERQAEHYEDLKDISIIKALASLGTTVTDFLQNGGNDDVAIQGVKEILTDTDSTGVDMSVRADTESLIQEAVDGGMPRHEAQALYEDIEPEAYNMTDAIVGEDDTSIGENFTGNRVMKISYKNGKAVYTPVGKSTMSKKEFFDYYRDSKGTDVGKRLAYWIDRSKNVLGTGDFSKGNIYLVDGKVYSYDELQAIALEPSLAQTTGVDSPVHEKNAYRAMYGDKIDNFENLSLEDIKNKAYGLEVANKLFKDNSYNQLKFDVDGNLISDISENKDLQGMFEWLEGYSTREGLNWSDKQKFDYLESEVKKFSNISIDYDKSQTGTGGAGDLKEIIDVDKIDNSRIDKRTDTIDNKDENQLIGSIFDGRIMDAFEKGWQELVSLGESAWDAGTTVTENIRNRNSSVNDVYPGSGNPMEKKSTNQKAFDWLIMQERDNLMA